MKAVLLWLIRFYRKNISPRKPPCCRFIPTCSQYALEAIEKSYADGVTDEFVVPCVTCEGGRVQEGDTVVFINFRPDRARQITRIFVDDDFKGFERRYGRFPVHYVCMAEYDATMPNVEVAYPPVELTNVLGEYLAKNGKTQLRIAQETLANSANSYGGEA